MGVDENPWSLQDGRVEVNHNPAAQARTIPMVNPEVEAGATTAKSRNEENGRRIYITKKMMSEFGATLGCKGCLEIGQPHTEEMPSEDHHPWMENDPAHAKRLEENLARGVEFAKPEPVVAAPSESRTNTPKRARHDVVGPPQKYANTGESWSSASGNDV